jgi:hypothetical protein
MLGLIVIVVLCAAATFVQTVKPSKPYPPVIPPGDDRTIEAQGKKLRYGPQAKNKKTNVKNLNAQSNFTASKIHAGTAKTNNRHIMANVRSSKSQSEAHPGNS